MQLVLLSFHLQTVIRGKNKPGTEGDRSFQELDSDVCCSGIRILHHNAAKLNLDTTEIWKQDSSLIKLQANRAQAG